jgi:DNA-binding CsgD family transcriptional regulator/tetratricopeptide (TPR) repeat protein
MHWTQARLGGQQPHSPEAGLAGGGSATLPDAVVGRDDELAAISRFLVGAGGWPGALVLRGDPGIGKSVLWRAGCAEARDRGFRTLACRPSEAEARISFAALADLLPADLDEAQDPLPPVHREALMVALGRVAGQGQPPHQGAIGLGLLGVLDQLASRSPVLVAIDDLQWLDRPSARVLSFALRRLASQPVAVLATERVDSAHSYHLDLARAMPDGRCESCSLGALTLGALHRLLRERLGMALNRTTLLRVHASSGGNPLWAVELARALGPGAGPLPPGGLLPVPTDLGRLLSRRLAALPTAAREALAVAAELASPSAGLVAKALGNPVRAASGLLAARRAGVIDLDGDAIVFTHPLLASVLLRQAPAAMRSARHRVLAGLVTDPEERARHLALGSEAPDESVAREVTAGAAVAAARGAPSSAGELLELASALMPAGDAAERLRLLAEAAGQHFRAGDAQRARKLLEDVVGGLEAGEDRADALRQLGQVRCHSDSFHAAHDLFRQALTETGGNLRLRAEVSLQASYCGLIFGDALGGAVLARDALAAAEQLQHPALVSGARAWAALFQFVTGGGYPAAEIDRALAGGPAAAAGSVEPALEPRLLAGTVMKLAGHLDQARELLRQLQDQAAEVGDDSVLPFLLYQLAELECWAGNWDLAASCAQRSDELAAESGQQVLRAMTLYARGLVAAHKGQADEARARLLEGLRLAQDDGCLAFTQLNLSGLGFLELSAGECAAARHSFAGLIDQVAAYGVAEPAVVRWVPDAVETLIADGDIGTADTILTPFESRAQLLDREWAIAAAARCRALFLAARGDLDAGLDRAETAMRHAARLAQPFEEARCQLLHGQLLRRARQKRGAQTSLTQALDTFDRLGARLWSARASDELGRIGLRRSEAGALTASEERVAGLAAAGLTNREVAGRLFMSPKTVDATLARVYRKLGVRSRTELAGRGPRDAAST